MRFPISSRRSLRNFEIYFKPQQLRVITLISAGIEESMIVCDFEDQGRSRRFWWRMEATIKEKTADSIIGGYT